MARIIGGRYSGRRVVTPPGVTTRPTAGLIRGAVANSLDATGALRGATVLDLFAGSGALGLELLSRGAERLVLVEQHRGALAAIRTTIADLGLTNVQLYPGAAASYVAAPGEVFDIVLADPPYDLSAGALADILTALHRSGGVAPGADIVVERAVRAGDFPWPEPLVARRAKRYGDTMIFYGVAP